MLSQLEWMQLELWTNDDGSIGWRMTDHLNESLDLDLARTMMLECGEWFIDPREEAPVLFSVYLQKNGLCHTRQNTRHDFSSHKMFLAVKSNLYRSHMHVLDMDTGLPRIRRLMWSLEWFWHKFLGHFKAHQTALAAAATPVARAPAEAVSDASEGLMEALRPVGGGGATVVPFRRRGKSRDDIRPL